MGHLHRQALLQRAKARDELISQGMEGRDAKALAAAYPLSEIQAATASPVSDIERPAKAAPKKSAKKKAAKRTRGKSRGKA